MPQAIAGALIPLLVSLGSVGAFGFTGTAFLALGLGYVATAGIIYAGSALLGGALGNTPDVPKPEDGKFNLKQNVPPLAYVLGQVKKAGDYAFLEEKGGTAYHIMVDAAHSIDGYQTHFLHDEQATLDVNGYVTAPSHFGSQNVRLLRRLGADASTAYSQVVSAFPDIWTSDHRGDGLSSVLMITKSVAAEDFQKVYPQSTPSRSAIIRGHNRLFDPRTETFGYSTNLALFRLWHLTHPVGGKMTIDDIYLPDWSAAADVCDETVLNRQGAEEQRYHGGFWFRANNNPVDVGRTIDEAADMVLYERPDGRIGVHAGAYAEPEVRLTADDIIACSFDPNRRASSRVLAVRGRFTDPAAGYNTADAAIYGDPYADETERTTTVENQAVQSHSHMARLQKLRYLRKRAPRVRIVAQFEAARLLPYARFVRVHLPPKLVESVIEITGRPTLSLRNLTYEFEGIVVPEGLYAFNAAAEEGAPGSPVTPVDRGDVPVPDVASITLQVEAVAGGATAAFLQVVFNTQSATFQYEVEWQPTAGGTVQSVTGSGGALTVRTGYLADGVQYRVRSRTWSSGTPSAWTAYTDITATSDPVAPGVATGVSAVGGAGSATFNWTAPNSLNYVGARLYLNTTNTMTGATLAATEFGPPNIADSRLVTGLGAGTLYGFVVAINASGVTAAAVATGAITVT